MHNNETRYKRLVPVLEGYEKEPGETLVVSIPIEHVPLADIQEMFPKNFQGGGMIITKVLSKILYKKTGIQIDPDKLEFYLEIYGSNSDRPDHYI